MPALPVPPPGPDDVAAWVRVHLGHLAGGPVRPSPRFRGTQAAADAALAGLDPTGYARDRNEVWPPTRRGATGLSPWIRHGLLDLPTVWAAAGRGPARDVAKLRDELAWQEYARHLYTRLGARTRAPLRYAAPPTAGDGDGWDPSMACVAICLDELAEDGWLVNQARMWLASQWAVRAGADWRAGEDRLFGQLLDGSRAANRLGWQWTIGCGTGKVYGFSRRQVERRAPGLCAGCARRSACPIGDWPRTVDPDPVPPDPRLGHDPDPARTAGPERPRHDGEPDTVWLTAESLGDGDPGLRSHPELPVVFVFDAPLLASLRLAGHRLVFLAERLAELAAEREVEVRLGRPPDELAGRRLAVTWAPVPGFRRIATRLGPVVRHPWPWLVRPHGGPITSFTAWRRAAGI